MKQHGYSLLGATMLAGLGLLAAPAAQAQTYAPDPSFGTGGKVLTAVLTPPASSDQFLDLEVQSADKLLVLVSSSTGLVKIGYLANGSLDASYGTAGLLRLAARPAGFTTATLQPYHLLADGRVLVAGRLSGNANTYLYRYAADGSLDTSFGTQGILTLGTNVMDYLPLPSGDILVASSTDVTTGVGAFSGGKMRIAELTPAGMQVFNTTLNHVLVAPSAYKGQQAIVTSTELAVQVDGAILAVGTGTEHDGSTEFLVAARLLASGSPDASFGTNGTQVQYLGTTADAATNNHKKNTRTILLRPGGGFLLNVSPSYTKLAGFTTAGQLDASYGNGGYLTGTDPSVPSPSNTLSALPLYRQADGKIVAATASASFALLRLNNQGQLDPLTTDGNTYLTVDFGGKSSASDVDLLQEVAQLSTGDLILAGTSTRDKASATHVAGPEIAIARLKASGALTVRTTGAAPAVSLYPNPVAGRQVQLSLTGVVGSRPLAATLYNALGQAVLSQPIPVTGTSASTRLVLPTLPAGTYRLRLVGEQWTGTYPLSVQ